MEGFLLGRVAFIFRMKPELKAEYKKAHDEIWPELVKVIKDSGFENYSIFFKKDGTLFAYLEVDDFEKAVSIQKKTEVYKRWQDYMEKYFVKEDSSILGPETEILEEVFHLD